MNLVAIAQFFHITCIAIMDYIIASGKQDGLLRLISYHYDMIEINGCSILYLHFML